jgi:curved DNA-binding protein CbpA
VLGILDGANVSDETITACYRRLAADAHPDRGGSHERMSELNAARDEALREARG